jgi:anti-anti-sigma factor
VPDVDGGAPLTVEVAEDGDVVIVRLAGEFDVASATQARETIDPALGDGTRRAVFDLGDLTFMDSSGLAVLLAVAQRVPVELRRPSSVIRQVIEMTGLADALPITEP